MRKFERGDKVYYKDWTDNDKIYPAWVQHCKYRYVILSVLVEGANVWETWEVNISDCTPTDDFGLVKTDWFGWMIKWKGDRNEV